MICLLNTCLLKEMWVKKKVQGMFFFFFFVGFTDHENSFPKIRSDPSWALWLFEIYWLIYHDKFNFDA